MQWSVQDKFLTEYMLQSILNFPRGKGESESNTSQNLELKWRSDTIRLEAFDTGEASHHTTEKKTRPVRKLSSLN